MLLAPLLTAFYDFANNYALKLVIDAFSADDQASFQVLMKPIILFVSANILLDVIWRIADWLKWSSEPFVRQAIINTVFDYVQHNPYHYFQDTQSGTITSRIKGIIDGYDNFWAAMQHDLSARLASVVVLTSVLAVVNVKISLFIGTWALVFLVVMYRLSQTMDRLSCINANSRHHILGLISDAISNIFTVFSFAARKTEIKNINKAINDDFIPSNIKVYKFGFISNLVAGIFYWFMLISIFIFMIHLRRTGEASSGDFVFVITTTLKMSWELWQAVQKLQDFMKNMGDLKSSFAIMKTPHDQCEIQSSKTLVIDTPEIDFRDVDFSYDTNQPIFSKLNLHIRAGEKIGLVGLSGAGKSTLISLLLRYFSIDGGKIFIDGKDISEYSVDSIRKNISVIPQDIVLFHRTVLENIRYGNESASKERVVQAAKLANIDDFIMSLPHAYDSMVGERGVRLSGGQRQRIAIARAILKDAPILILDEATSSLDTKTEQLIQTSLNTLLEKSNTTVIAIAHRLSTIKHMDRIIVLQQGKIIEEGRHEELLKNQETYKKLWHLQKI
ncbi:MAG: ABC transporter ATP-binding protein [Myxococcales bacterium]|nr:MAG: ABC transporter ATP-binding protein [Myxococcales bacterium]